MKLKEKKLYHQIYPIKLITDWTTGVISLYLLWQHQVALGLLVMFIPSVILSLVLVKYVDLEKLKKSRLGLYLRHSMTNWMEAVRFIGFGIAILGAWFHFVTLIVLGLLIILFGWFRGSLTEYLDNMS